MALTRYGFQYEQSKRRYHAKRICYDYSKLAYYVHPKEDQTFLKEMSTLRHHFVVEHLPQKFWNKSAMVVPGRTISIDLSMNIYHSFVRMCETHFLLNGNNETEAIQADHIVLSGQVSNWKKGM